MRVFIDCIEGNRLHFARSTDFPLGAAAPSKLQCSKSWERAPVDDATLTVSAIALAASGAFGAAITALITKTGRSGGMSRRRRADRQEARAALRSRPAAPSPLGAFALPTASEILALFALLIPSLASRGLRPLERHDGAVPSVRGRAVAACP